MNLRNRLPFLLYASKYQDLIVEGTDKLDLQDALKDWLYYVNAYGKSVQSNVPYDYRELEYIESTGTQYIDTGITNQDCDNYTVKTKYNYTSSASNSLCGNLDTATSSFGQIYLNAGSSSVWAGNGNVQTCIVSSSVVTGVDYTDEFTVDCTTGDITRNFNGTSLSGSGLNFSTRSSRSCWLFGTNATGTTHQFGSEKIYYFKIYKDNQLVFNGIPCINPTGQIGMYDTVTQQFFSNIGTGEFIAGPEIVASLPSPYVRIDYVDMQAGSYAITDIIPKLDYSIEIDFKTTTVQPQNTCYFGTRSSTSSGAGISIAHTNIGEYVFDAFGQRFSPNITFSNNTRYLYSYNNGTISLSSGGSVLYTNTTTPTDIVTHPFIINALNNIGTAYGNYESIYLYSFKVRDNAGKLIADYVPARIDARAFLYDRVTNQTLIQDTGTWGLGPDTIITYIPTPNNPIDIWCNNGALRVDANRDVYTDGIVEKINVFSKNLFNDNLLAGDTSTLIYTSFSVPNGTYTMSSPDYPFTAGITNVFFLAGNVSSGANSTTNGVASTHPITITVTDGYYTIAHRYDTIANPADPRNYKWQIEQGSTATEYISYNDSTATCEDLLAVDSFIDEQAIISGNVTRKLGIKVFDGTEDWSDGAQAFRFILDATNFPNLANLTNNYVGLSNCYTIIPTSQGIQGVLINNQCGWNTSQTFCLRDNRFVNGVADFKAWLVSQYNAGTPVIIVYPLATATTSTILEQPLQLENGNNVLQITEASLDHLKLEAKYRKRKQ